MGAALRFCLDLSHHPWRRADDPAAAARTTLAASAAADAAGIDAIWATEDPDGWDAFALLGAIAAVTRRCRLGTGVTSPLLRHPNLVAASVATLDRLSGGRAVLGLGRGQPEWYERGLGVAADRPLARVDETIALLRAWEDAPHRASSEDGDVFAVRDWERTVGPIQRTVPILVAAAGPKALALAGKSADGVVFNALSSDAYLSRAIDEVRAAAAAAGRDPAAPAFVLRTEATVTDTPAVAIKDLKSRLALVNTLPGMERTIETDGFDVPAVVANLRRLLDTEDALAHGRSFADIRRHANFAAAREVIPDALILRLGIVGSVTVVHERLATLAGLGITHVSVQPPADPSEENWNSLLAALRSAAASAPT